MGARVGTRARRIAGPGLVPRARRIAGPGPVPRARPPGSTTAEEPGTGSGGAGEIIPPGAAPAAARQVILARTGHPCPAHAVPPGRRWISGFVPPGGRTCRRSTGHFGPHRSSVPGPRSTARETLDLGLRSDREPHLPPLDRSFVPAQVILARPTQYRPGDAGSRAAFRPGAAPAAARQVIFAHTHHSCPAGAVPLGRRWVSGAAVLGGLSRETIPPDRERIFSRARAGAEGPGIG